MDELTKKLIQTVKQITETPSQTSNEQFLTEQIPGRAVPNTEQQQNSVLQLLTGRKSKNAARLFSSPVGGSPASQQSSISTPSTYGNRPSDSLVSSPQSGTDFSSQIMRSIQPTDTETRQPIYPESARNITATLQEPSPTQASVSSITASPPTATKKTNPENTKSTGQYFYPDTFVGREKTNAEVQPPKTQPPKKSPEQPMDAAVAQHRNAQALGWKSGSEQTTAVDELQGKLDQAITGLKDLQRMKDETKPYGERWVDARDQAGHWVRPESVASTEEDMRRWSEKARHSGTDIASVRADEINAAVKSRREAQEQESTRKRSEEWKAEQKRMEELATRAGFTDTNETTRQVRVIHMQRSMRSANIDPTKATDDDVKAHAGAYDKYNKELADNAFNEANRRVQRMRDRGQGGTIMSRSGERIDVDSLLTTNSEELRSDQSALRNWQRRVGDASRHFANLEREATRDYDRRYPDR